MQSLLQPPRSNKHLTLAVGGQLQEYLFFRCVWTWALKKIVVVRL